MEIIILFAVLNVAGLIALAGILWYQHKQRKNRPNR